MERDELRVHGRTAAVAIAAKPTPVPRPFDRRELDCVPKPTDQDPPYRPWWVVD